MQVSGPQTVRPFLMNLAAILAAKVTVFSAHAACWCCCLRDRPRGRDRMVRLIQKKSFVKLSFTSYITVRPALISKNRGGTNQNSVF